VREVVDAEGGVDSGVDSRIWTASLSYLAVNSGPAPYIEGVAYSSISSSIEKPLRSVISPSKKLGAYLLDVKDCIVSLCQDDNLETKYLQPLYQSMLLPHLAFLRL
jgi:hypothetical protein